MNVTALEIEGAAVVEWTPAVDERGSFVRIFDAAALAGLGFDGRVAEMSIATNAAAMTLRGLHWQRIDRGESKIVRCTRGRMYDVLVDVRPASDTYGRWVGLALEGGDGRAVVVPPGVAHGYLTLVEETDVLYVMSVPYDPEADLGLRWDDSTVGITWPATPVVMSARDRTLNGWPPGS